jgi:hypothetical protein
MIRMVGQEGDVGEYAGRRNATVIVTGIGRCVGTSFRVCNICSVDREETQLNGMNTDRSLHLAVFQPNR